MIILLDTSISTCFLTIVNGENRQDFEWEAGRTMKKLLCQSTAPLRISLRRENNFYRPNRQNRV